MFKKIAFFTLFLAVTGLFAATSVNAQRLVKGSLVKSTSTTDTLVELEPEAVGFTTAQCANGGVGDPVQDCGVDPNPVKNNWDTGNMNGAKAHYAEGTSIHYRYAFTGLSSGTSYTIRLAYDAWQQDPSKNAIDYLNTYDAGIDPLNSYQVVPCGGVIVGCTDLNASTFNIPDDPLLANYTTTAGAEGIEPPFVDGSRVFTGWNMTITNAVFEPYDPASMERVIAVTFTANSDTAVLSWSGHIADTDEWNAFIPGYGGATSIPGSPYHMRNAGNATFTGQKELQLATSAVVTVPSAAGVDISGRVTDAYGRAISSARLTLNNATTGEVMVVYTNTFGFYSFKDVTVGDYFVLTAEHRRYVFANNVVTFNLQDSIVGLDFKATR